MSIIRVRSSEQTYQEYFKNKCHAQAKLKPIKRYWILFQKTSVTCILEITDHNYCKCQNLSYLVLDHEVVKEREQEELRG